MPGTILGTREKNKWSKIKQFVFKEFTVKRPTHKQLESKVKTARGWLDMEFYGNQKENFQLRLQDS